MIDTKTTVLLGDTDIPEVLTLKDQLAQMTVMMAISTAATSHPTDGASHHKRARANKNGKTYDCVQGRHHMSYVQVEWTRHQRLLSWFNTKNKMRETAKMKSDSEDILKFKKNNKKVYVTGFAANKSDESCCNCASLKCYRACTDSCAMLPSRFHDCSVVLDQVFVPATKVSVLDIGDMSSIIQGTQRTDSRVQLVGVTGDGMQDDIAYYSLGGSPKGEL
jgi:hypothetical protein